MARGTLAALLLGCLAQHLPDTGLGTACDQPLHSPVDVMRFGKYSEMPLAVRTTPAKNALLTREGPGNFALTGAFGAVVYAEFAFAVERVRFRVPGEHRVGGLGFPLELQLEAVTADGRHLTLSVLFEALEDYTNPALAALRLGHDLERLPPDRTLRLHTASVAALTHGLRHFYMYQGQRTTGNCPFTVNFVSAATLLVGVGQLGGLGVAAAARAPLALLRPDALYQNFVFARPERLFRWWVAVQVLVMSDAPVPPELSPYMYEPSLSGLPLGVFPADTGKVLPAWQRPSGAEPVPDFVLSPEVKLLPVYYQLVEGVWQPRLVVVPRAYDADWESVPDYLPVYLRANYMLEHNNVRPLYLVDMPLSFTG